MGPTRLVSARSRRLALAGLTALLILPADLSSQEAPAAPEAAPATSAAGPTPPGPGEILRIEIASIIHPLAADFLVDALRQADEAKAEALLIELNTPGGLLTSTRAMFTAMLGAATPVVVFVAPSGAQAASAGFFLLMAADVAAMAPGTNTGAAHPVSAGGDEVSGVMGEKMEEDAAATIRSLARRNGRNAELAEAAVVESRSFTADEALEQGLIDLVVPDLPALLASLDGRELELAGGERRPLRTAGATVRTLEMTAFQRFLSAIAHPEIAYLLLTLGGLGLYFELANPGAILPGVVGGIFLLLALYALSVLPINYAGAGLIILAAIFFVAEIKVASFGLLTAAGVVALVLGSLMLFKSADLDPAVRVGRDVITSVTVAAVAVVSFLAVLAIRAHRQPVRTGAEGMVHERGVARTELAPRGKVLVHGEIWEALAEERVAPGEEVEVLAMEGLRLRVRRPGGPRAERPEEGA